VAKKFLILLGIIQKYYKVIPAEGEEAKGDNDEH
jgi:hypothetical protein